MPATERVTITLPVDLLSEVDQFERNRSRFIAEAVQREVTRRRRAALMESMPQAAPPGAHLRVIPGTVPRAEHMPEGCRFP